VTSVPYGMVTAIVFPVSFIAPATPSREYDVIALADDDVLEDELHPSAAKRNIAANSIYIFFISLLLY